MIRSPQAFAAMPDRPRYPIPAPAVLLAPIVALALIVILSVVARPGAPLPRAAGGHARAM